MDKKCVLYLDDEPENLLVFKTAFRHDYNVITTTNWQEALNFLRNVPIDVVLSDYKMPQKNGIDFFVDIGPEFPELRKILITAYSEPEIIIKSVNEAHIYSYIRKPWNKLELKTLVDRAIESGMLERQNKQLFDDLKVANTGLLQANEEITKLKQRIEQENEYLKSELDQQYPTGTLVVGSSQAILDTMAKARQVASVNTTVLILGETGTGKELVARTIHKASQRHAAAFVKLNCAALPLNLVESELFGYEKGAFTGAMQRKAGLFEIADGGTIFLDEIGEVPLEVQSKLLRILQEGEYYPVGGVKPKKVDVRVVAATNRDLMKEIDRGTFRSDLYYRLNVFPIKVPALRDRLEDISPLLHYFVELFQRKLGVRITGIPEQTERLLRTHSWPGNIRELEAVIERSMILSAGNKLDLSDWTTTLQPVQKVSVTDENLSLIEMEKRFIIDVLNRCNWKISGKGGAAESLEMNHNTLRSKMIKLGIQP